jgi:hypothetical protein
MNDRNHKPASSSSSSSHILSGLEEEVKFVKTREDVLQAIGQPDKKRKREDVPSLNNLSEGMPEAKRMKREENNGPKDLELVTIKNEGNPSILVMNFGVKKE